MSTPSPAEQQLRDAYAVFEQALLKVMPDKVHTKVTPDPSLLDGNDGAEKIVTALKAWKRMSLDKQKQDGHSQASFAFSVYSVMDGLIRQAEKDGITQFDDSGQIAQLLHNRAKEVQGIMAQAVRDPAFTQKQETEFLFIMDAFAELLGAGQQYRLLGNAAGKGRGEPPPSR